MHDNFVNNIAQVYDDVLRRHRFGFFTKDKESEKNLVKFTILAGGHKFEAVFIMERRDVSVIVFWCPVNEYRKKFYTMVFQKTKTEKVRKAALILAKKIMMKPVYDVMEK